MLTCVFGGHNTLRRPEYFRLQNAFYLAMVRPSFALSVAWVIWACSTNHGGKLNWFKKFDGNTKIINTIHGRI